MPLIGVYGKLGCYMSYYVLYFTLEENKKRKTWKLKRRT